MKVNVKASAWPEAAYVLTVRANKEVHSCEFSAADHFSCERLSGGITGDDPKILQFSAFIGAPEEIEIQLTADGIERLSTTVRPEYETHRPNGFLCEPTCTNAQLDLTADP